MDSSRSDRQPGAESWRKARSIYRKINMDGRKTVVLHVRMLYSNNQRPRVRRFFDWLRHGATQMTWNCQPAWNYEPFRGLLVVWGCGHPTSAAAAKQHAALGQPVVCWDVGYWGKCMRLAFGGHHPAQLPDGSAARFNEFNIPLRNDYDPKGHVVIVGLGPKSRYMAKTWEEDALKRVHECLPGRRIVYRPKPRREFVALPVHTDNESSIESVLSGASLVVTRHSNVGIDACIAGVPVVTELGAASLLYGNDLTNPVVPTEAERRAFLERIAWLNWRDEEARGAGLWTFIARNIARNPSATG